MFFDYSSLNKRVTLRECFETKDGWWLLVCYILLSAVALAVGAVMLFWPDGVVVIAITLLPYAALLVWSAHNLRISAVRYVRLREFATDNRVAYRRNVPFDGREGLFFNSGHSRKYVEVLFFETSSRAELGNFMYTEGYGRSSSTNVVGYMTAQLTRRLPHLILDSRQNNAVRWDSNLPQSLRKDQRLELEGDFNQYFQLFVPDQYESDALYILTPDIMELLVTRAAAYDVEIIDNQVHFYANGLFKLDDQETLTSLVAILEELVAKLERQTDYYYDERVESRELNVVAPLGARLKKRGALWAIMTVIVVSAIIHILFQMMAR